MNKQKYNESTVEMINLYKSLRNYISASSHITSTNSHETIPLHFIDIYQINENPVNTLTEIALIWSIFRKNGRVMQLINLRRKMF